MSHAFAHLHPATLAIHAGQAPDPAAGAVVPPLHLSTTFVREPDGSYRDGFVYTRTDNPNRRALETALAALDGANHPDAVALAFGSGLAATTALLQTLRPGDHLLLPDDVYFGTAKVAREIFAPWGLQVSEVDMTNLDAVRGAVRDSTELVWMETPSNPLLKITDVAAVAEIAREAGARSVCDATWPSPALLRPLDHGVDFALHSTTKYLGGHSDLLGGAIIAREQSEVSERLRTIQGTGGAVPSPFDCWLLLRGVRTLAVRMAAHCQNAVQIAEFLHEHTAVETVHYPGLPSHPGHETAARQMSGFGGMLSVQIKGGEEAARRVANRTRLFTQATSLGGVESLIEHRRSIEGPQSRTPANLLRVSVGIEHVDDLVADLAQALGE